MRSLRRMLMALAVVALVLLALPLVAWAQERGLEGKVRGGATVVVPADETVPGDLIVSGGTIRVEGEVQGDLVAVGGQIVVSGTVGGDALLAGGDVSVGGDVEGDLRVGAGQVVVSGSVGEDVLLGAAGARVSSSATIGEDLVLGTREMRLDGNVSGSVLGSANQYVRTGEVGGTEEVTIDDRGERREEPTVGDRVLAAVRRAVSLLLVGALLLWLAPRLTLDAADRVRERPLPSLAAGALGLLAAILVTIGLVIVTVLLGVLFGLTGLGDLAGLAVGLGGLATVGFVLAVVVATGFLANVVVGLVLGRLALPGEGGSRGRLFAALAIGIIVVVVLGVIPIIGGLVQLLVVLLGLGALLLLAQDRRRRPAPQAPPAQASGPPS